MRASISYRVGTAADSILVGIRAQRIITAINDILVCICPERIFVTADIRELGNTSVVFKQQILKASKTEEQQKHGDHVVLAEGNVTVVAVDTIKFRAKRLPNFFVAKIKEEIQ